MSHKETETGSMLELISKEAFLSEMAKRAAPHFFEGMTSAVKKNVGKLGNYAEIGFNKYFDRIYDRLSFTKTIVSGNTPVRLNDIYVNLILNSAGKSIADSALIEESQKKNGERLSPALPEAESRCL